MAWYEDDEFWATFGSYIYSDERLRAAPAEVDQLLTLCPVAHPDVLDLCCGTGRHAVAFAKKGCRVTGVDRTRMALERARAAAAEAGVAVEFVEQDMREFVRPASFDLAVNMFTSFGYFESVDDERRVLRNLQTSLRPGGTLVIDVVGKEILARGFQETHSARGPDGTLFVWRNAIAEAWTRVAGEWHAVREGRARSFKVDHWIYSGRELRDLLRQAGFGDVSLFGDLAGQEYDTKATRLIAVARK